MEGVELQVDKKGFVAREVEDGRRVQVCEVPGEEDGAHVGAGYSIIQALRGQILEGHVQPVCSPRANHEECAQTGQ